MTEEIEARRDGAKLQRNSGRGWKEKGDAILGPFLVDYKEGKRSFTFNEKIWSKVCTDAFVEKKQPLLKVILGEDEPKTRVFIVSEHMMRELHIAYKFYLESLEENEASE